MSKKGTARVSIVFISLFCGLLFCPLPAQAIRPFLTTETAIPVEPNRSLLEGGLKFERFGRQNRLYTLDAELRYGLITNLDFEVEVPYLFADRGANDESGLGDLHLKGKVRLLKGREANPLSLAGMIDVKFPSASRDKQFGTGEADVGIIGIASKEFFPLTLHLNLGYIFVGNPTGQSLGNVVVYSLGAELQTILSGLKVVGELSGRSDRDDPNATERLDILGGVAVGVTPALDIDLSLFFGLIKESPDYGISGGFAYRF
jgi:hypothetical protein